jgi:hypothetical protein
MGCFKVKKPRDCSHSVKETPAGITIGGLQKLSHSSHSIGDPITARVARKPC